MTCSISLANRLGFTILGLTNNFAYVIMLSAAYDLLAQTTNHNETTIKQDNNNYGNLTKNETKPYCNAHSTSTILLADTLPSLLTKLTYPFLLVGIHAKYKAIGTAFLSAISFIITGITTNEVLIFTGVICASFSSGLGESTFLSNTPLYGDVALTGWSIGTGAAGLFGSISYALLTMVFSIKIIMIIMLVVPIAMIMAFFCVIQQVHNHSHDNDGQNDDPSPELNSSRDPVLGGNSQNQSNNMMVILSTDSTRATNNNNLEQQPENVAAKTTTTSSQNAPLVAEQKLDSIRAKFFYLPTLAKYFLPLLLVYFAEYFINQGLFEIIYFPEVEYLDHRAQYRWFQVSYQLGVFISRSSLDFLQIKNLWTMSLLQLLNAALFLVHASKLIHIPSFYIVIALIIYEGLLGGFTYVNAFYRVRKEVSPDKQEFSISAVTTADSLGIVVAALLALPVHDALCKLYM